jgi:outer membrane receptor for Fe3+-dicitrate
LQNLSAQKLQGHILDHLGSPISYADILNFSNNTHTHSDETGYFSLNNITLNDTIKVIFLGYQTETLIIDNLNKTVKIALQEKSISLDEVIISPQMDALNVITSIDIQTNPVNSAQEVLTRVPGLFIGQHAGGGKAEQIFLRGFDIDHGTDININVDGLPGNMVSHAHGQGYTDMHFVIPETIENINFGKGPYDAQKGNFTTAGFIEFKTKDKLRNSLLKIEGGDFGWKRILNMMNLVATKSQNAYIASEHISSDGPFESPQNFKRTNIFGKYSSTFNQNNKIEFSLSHFTSEWDASGQIPQRAVDAGLITRFGAIDDTEGGQTSRTNFNLSLIKYLSPQTTFKTQAFYSLYDFELYSNFTFALEDPVNGDQIKQKEDRQIYGLNTSFNHAFPFGSDEGIFTMGFQLRNDKSSDNELSRTLNRDSVLENIQLGDINETNLGAFANLEINIGKWLINPGIRIDHFDFQYNNFLAQAYSTQTDEAQIVSPKLNILYNHSKALQLYIKTGKGFHSNDTRTVLRQNGQTSLPAAYGLDAGFIWKPFSKLFINSAYWYLFLDQEFVYVGDAGIVEPSGKTRRYGLDLSLRYQALEWLFINSDINYAIARSVEEEEGNDYIPLAPDFTLTSGIQVLHPSGISGGLHLRMINDRPANEDYSIVAESYTVVDMNVNYKWNRYQFGVQIQNLLNTEWNETQFATESQLFSESEATEEIHFTPGTPFFLKGSFQFSF